jgi:hypothetical protein
MQMPVKGWKLHHSSWMLISGYVCAATMAVMLLAAVLEAPGSAFIGISALGLTVTVGLVLLADRSEGQ